MEITIVKGSKEYINDCEEALANSELGIRYFSNEGSARKALEEGFAKEEIYIAIDINHNCKGFIWFILDGIFHSFPYLHIIAVKKESSKSWVMSALMGGIFFMSLIVQVVILEEWYMATVQFFILSIIQLCLSGYVFSGYRKNLMNSKVL